MTELRYSRRARSPRRVPRALGATVFAFVGLCAAPSLPAQTADLPESWLVLYNLNLPDSVAWAEWYQAERLIPADHMLGLCASSEEHLADLATAQAQVIGPVRNYLAAHQEVAQQVVGILVGYGVPGHYAQPPQVPTIGGFSIADALQDMTDDALSPASQKGTNQDCPHTAGLILPAGGRLTRTTMRPDRYMVARIDGPTVQDAMQLTVRAKALSQASHTLHGQKIWYDYHDPSFPPSSHEWVWLKRAVEHASLADVPWTVFDLKGQSATPETPEAAFRFDIYKLYGWTLADFASDSPGSLVCAFDFNSFGAVTVRSTTAQGGLLVPNALAAGYAAAIGATGEPVCCVGPFPDTFLSALREGWTLGEAFYLANYFNDWMWTLIGDPFLTLPNWFDPIPITPGTGDMNGDGGVDGEDIQGFVAVLTGSNNDPAARAAADLNGDGQLNDDDAFLILGPLAFGSYDQNILRGSGDASGDGRVDGGDIAVFMDQLLNGYHGDESLRVRFASDMNKDTFLTVDDVPLFVQALLRQ